MASQQPPGGSPPTTTPSSPNCPTAVCSPTCSAGYNCTLNVIVSIGECPKASCVKINFQTGAGNGDDDGDSNGSKSSVIGPIIGAIAGLVVIAVAVYFVIRRRRQKHRSSVLMLEQDEYNDLSNTKRWNPSSGSEFEGHKDVIRIAYIPSMIGDSPNSRPASAALTAPQPQFAALKDEDRNKHDSIGSVGSHTSAVLDEAVVMAMTTKATPQVMKLNTIKATQSDLIQRSNSLHTSNSIKRSNSKRRIADAKNSTSRAGQRNPSPLAGNYQITSDSDCDSDTDSIYAAPQVEQTRRRSAGKQNNVKNPFMSVDELLSIGSPLPSPSVTSTSSRSNNNNEDTLVSHKGPRTSNPFVLHSESATLIPDLANHTKINTRFSTVSSSAPSPALSASSAFASIPIRLGDDNDPLSPFADHTSGGSSPLRPWMSSSASAMRDSTFSTISDSRSSTRGDGEEIMIFWGGQHNRDSKASNL
ncbi:hypothetical protein FBU30_003056 [Linnemannia zychae]|nr:hypothetical protein FBU30_003056 [Linnemannia zychae]